MPATSLAQKRLFSMVKAHQHGKLRGPVSPQIAEMASTISPTDVGHFSKTPQHGLPERVKKAFYRGFLKQAYDPLPVTQQGNLTRVGSGIAHNRGGTAEGFGGPNFQNSPYPGMVAPTQPTLMFGAHGGGPGEVYRLSNREPGQESYRHFLEAATSRGQPWWPSPDTRKLYAGLQNKNPSAVVSPACNSDPNGAGPENYAGFLAGLRGQERGPLNLDKVTMVPRGNLGVSGVTSTSPYLREWMGKHLGYGFNKNEPYAPLHDFHKIPGADPLKPEAWQDTGVNPDNRAIDLPNDIHTTVQSMNVGGLAGVLRGAIQGGREALPLLRSAGTGAARGLGIGAAATTAAKILGEGREWAHDIENGVNHLDKLENIATNPYTSYTDKVLSNSARPIGAPLQAVRSTGQLLGSMWNNLQTGRAVDQASDLATRAAGWKHDAAQHLNTGMPFPTNPQIGGSAQPVGPSWTSR